MLDDGDLTLYVELNIGCGVVASVDRMDETAKVGFGFCLVTLVVVVWAVFAGIVVLSGVAVCVVFCDCGFLLVVV